MVQARFPGFARHAFPNHLWLRQMQVIPPYLQCIIHIRTCIRTARIYHILQAFIRSNLEADTNRGCWNRRPIIVIVDRNRIVQGHIARYGGIAIIVVGHGSASRPDDDGIRIGISRSYAVSEVELARGVRSSAGIAFVDFVDGDSQAWMIPRGASIVEITCVGGNSRACEGQGSQ